MTGVNEEIFRGREMRVKAIIAYLSKEQVTTDDPLEDQGRTSDITGEGLPRIRFSLKESKRYGKQLEVLFFGRRKTETWSAKNGKAPKTFGYMVLSKEQVREMIVGLEEVEKELDIKTGGEKDGN